MRRLLPAGAALLTSALLVPWSPVHAAPDSTTFTHDVAPILNAKCVTCHRAGEVAPMALLTYQDARPYARAIKEKVASRQMPPWFADKSAGTFANDPSLTDAEIATITRWVDAGAPQGDPKDMPKPPQFTEGWQLGEPDQIIELPEVQIPATGGDYFPTPSLTPDLKEDRWIRAIEIRPSNRQITHHSVIFSASIDMMRQTGTFDVLGVWAVGTPATVYPEGSGRWIRKGQMLRTNLHYHPNGTPQTDRTRIGLYFGKGELKKEVAAGLAGNLLFTIPANAPNHELRAVYVADQDINIVSFFPHMHLRGRDMTMTASFPGGRKETLLHVPAYDFNWQLFYYPKNTVALPKGTRLDLVAHYDNSAANRNNPDASKPVRFGEASTAEMMFGMFEFTAANGVSPTPSTERTRMTALLSSFPDRSAFLIEVPFGPEPTLSVFHLPRSGEGASLYWTTVGPLIGPGPVQDLKWDGNAFAFQTALLGGRGAGFYNVTGTVEADGTVKGTMRRRGPTQPPSYDFTGTAAAPTK
ncbi:MAG TPA: hypothetical protein VGP77_10520 [Vicinamibacterales bacterium]|jgi:hypothetical protein|nr:hypothetical protein [Vicinamibacterales bacterium]